MASLLAKRISRVSPFSQHHPLPLLSPLLRLALSTRSQSQSQQPKEEMPFIAQYLVSSFGISPERALRVSISQHLTGIKSPDRPNELVSFLKEVGLSDLQVRKIISFHPRLLNCSVDNCLKPTTRALMESGITGELFFQLIRSNPKCLHSESTISHLQFWRKFVGDSDEALFKLIKYNGLLMTSNIHNNIMPKISLLREYGLSNQQIVKLITSRGNVLSQSIDSLRWALKQTEKLGILRESNLYSLGVRALSGLTEKKLGNKSAFFNKMYNWSEEEFCSAFQKFPNFLTLSEENILQKMDFLIKKAGIEPRTIASQPRLLSCSMERMVPRHTVLSTLLIKGLRKKGSLLSVCVLSEERFLKEYVIPYEKDLPELAKSYAAARAGSA